MRNAHNAMRYVLCVMHSAQYRLRIALCVFIKQNL